MVNLFNILVSLLKGLEITVVVALGAFALMIPCAFLGGLARLSQRRLFRTLASLYIETFRGTSALVQLYWFYFALPLIGISFPALLTGIVVLGLNGGAYGAEVVRGGFSAVPKGQKEAALALNLTPKQTRWKILFPQALSYMLPPLGNLSIELLKSTALVSLITLADLTFRAQVLRMETQQTKRIFAITLILYFLLAMGIRSIFKRIEHKFSFVRS